MTMHEARSFRSSTVGNQTTMAILAPVKDGFAASGTPYLESLRRLAALGSNGAGRMLSVIPTLQWLGALELEVGGRPGALVIVVFDGQAYDYMKLTAEAFPELIFGFWDHFEGFPGRDDWTGCVDWWNDRAVPMSFVYAANPEITAVDARRFAEDSALLRERRTGVGTAARGLGGVTPNG